MMAPPSTHSRDTERVVEQNIGLVHHVARQIASRTRAAVELDDLVSAGTLGLIQAVSAFDASRGHSLSTFAVPRIRGAILDELRRHDSLPRSARKRWRAVTAATAELQRERGRAPSERDIAARLGVAPAMLRRWQLAGRGASLVSLDSVLAGAPDAATPHELLADGEGSSVETRLTLESEVELLRSAMEELKDQERNVLALYYYEGLKLQEIGDVMGLSACRISQIRTGALARLRRRLASLRAA